MKKNASFKINGEQTQVSIEAPDNLCESIGHHRASQLLFSFGIAHWVQSKVKAAYALYEDKEALAKANESTRTTAKEIIGVVELGGALEFMDFVPAARGEDKVVAILREKWPTASDEGKAKWLKARGLDETLAAGELEEVIAAYLASKGDENLESALDN